MNLKKIRIAIGLAIASNTAYAACTNDNVPYPLPAGTDSPAAGSNVVCTDISLPGAIWTGENDITITFEGNIATDPTNTIGIVRVDTYGSGHTSYTAQNVTVANNANITGSSSRYGMIMSGGDQTNPDNGNLIFNNNKKIEIEKSNGIYSVASLWSPTGKAEINNNENAILSGLSDAAYVYTVKQDQRGVINNKKNAKIFAKAKMEAVAVIQIGNAGFIESSGYAPNYFSSEYTEIRGFVLNNQGVIAAEGGYYAMGVHSYYPEKYVLNNQSGGIITAKVPAGATGSAAIAISTAVEPAIYNNVKSYGDIRSQKSPYVINNAGTIEGIDGAIAIQVYGKSFDGVFKQNIIDGSFNPDININNQGGGAIIGNVILADGKENLILEDNSNFNGKINFAGGSDNFDIHNIASFVSDSVNGGDDLSIADGAIDNLSYVGYVGNAFDESSVKNFENFNIKDSSKVTFDNDYNSANYLQYSIDSSSTAKYTGNSKLNANVTNTGLIDLTGNGAVGDNLMIVKRAVITGTNATDGDDGAKGDFNHTGTFKTDVDFVSLKADTITVDGNFSTKKADDSNGEGLVEINNVNKSTNPNTGQKIDLIIAANDSIVSDENLNLVTNQRYNGNARLGLLGNDPYIWELKTKENGNGHNWILTYLKEKPTPKPAPKPTPKPVVRPEIPAFSSLPTIAKEQSVTEQQRLHTRLGELRNCNESDNICLDEDKLAGWMRSYGGKTSFDGESSFVLSGDYKGMNLGFDKRIYTSNDLVLYTGVFADKYDGDWNTTGQGSKINAIDSASVSIDGWSVGAYATAFTSKGTYVDGVLRYSENKANITAPDHSSSTRGETLTGSVEVGHSFTLANQWTVEPQVQLTVTNVDWDDIFVNGSQISIDSHTYLTGRLGARVEKSKSIDSDEIKPWVYAGVNHEFSDTADITYGSTKFDSQDYGTVGEFRVGITVDIKQGFSIYGGVGYTSNFDDYENVNGHLGIRATW